MILDGISASQHLDSSGEVLVISGHDISDLNEGKGVLNWEHNNDSSEDIIGAIIFAKKIMKKTDCSNDRERLYWDACGTPFVYIKAELFDDEEHPGAVAAAAMIRYYHKKDEKILAGFSIEGSTLERSDNVLNRSVGRRVALTLRPCNKSAIAGVLVDGKNDEVKKYMNLNETSNIKTVEVDTYIFDDIEKTERTERQCLDELRVAIHKLQKTLTAGSYNVAPSMLTGGSALQVEHQLKRKKVGLPKDVKERLKRAVDSWDKKRPLREAVKAMMPEVSDEYIDHFTGLAEDLSIKKGFNPPIRIDPYHSWNTNMNDKQRKLVSGLYMERDSRSNNQFTDKNFTRDNVTLHKNDAGQEVSVSHPRADTVGGAANDPAVAAAAYYKMASDFFGMGDHVPVTNHFNHTSINKTDGHLLAQELIEGSHTPFDSQWVKTLQKGRDDGSAHKLAVMDMILGGDYDRNSSRMIGKDGKIINIDNGNSFNYETTPLEYPAHFNDHVTDEGEQEPGMGNDLMHIDAINWLSNLNPRDMVRSFLKSGMDKSKALNALQRLKAIQAAASGSTMNQIHDAINPKKKGAVDK